MPTVRAPADKTLNPSKWKILLPLLRYLVLQAILCVAIAGFIGWSAMELDSKARTNEFRGLYVVLALYVSPWLYALTLPLHLYVFFRVSTPKRYAVSAIAMISVAVACFLFFYLKANPSS